MIQPTDNSRSPIQFNPAKAQPSKAKPEAAQKLDRLDTDSVQQLREAVAKEPAIRPELVELGRKLSADPDYPPAHVVEKLAELLSQDFDEEGV